MLGNYKLFNIEDGPITAISADLYILKISGASYINIENLENPFKVIGSIYVPKYSYKKIINNLSNYNKKIFDSYRLEGTIFDISYIGPQYSKLEKYIKGKPVEILQDHDLDDKIEMITNDWNLYQLANIGKGVKMAVKISIFSNYQGLYL
ncbi:Uncharacterized protein Nst1_478 [Candidatus Nanobsidianus stetteri]|uniref:Uncharacterized protein n=1 Tax=Nanobsidianus stetteri TaxID=1294122 RepID=R1E486_NANST|nr:Uncharacterized protein Nst1_478 [Candidatus Nanobsidianus stetteri]